jgi:hypothetical protein
VVNLKPRQSTQLWKGACMMQRRSIAPDCHSSRAEQLSASAGDAAWRLAAVQRALRGELSADGPHHVVLQVDLLQVLESARQRPLQRHLPAQAVAL